MTQEPPWKMNILSFLHYFHLGVSCDWCIGVSSRGVIDIQLSIGWANHLKQKESVTDTEKYEPPASAREGH